MVVIPKITWTLCIRISVYFGNVCDVIALGVCDGHDWRRTSVSLHLLSVRLFRIKRTVVALVLR